MFALVQCSECWIHSLALSSSPKTMKQLVPQNANLIVYSPRPICISVALSIRHGASTAIACQIPRRNEIPNVFRLHTSSPSIHRIALGASIIRKCTF